MRILFCSIMLVAVFSQLDAQIRGTDRHAGPLRFELQAETQPREGKSILLAVGLSLIVPGAGEMYAGNMRTGRYLMAADGALWLTYAGFVLHGNWVMDDARTFAAMKSGANFSGKDDRFDVNVGNFMSTDAYNETRLRNREYEDVYSGNSYHWMWLQEGDRQHYRNLRIKSDQIHQSSEFIIGALVVNRIISALLAWRSVQSANATNEFQGGWRLESRIQHTGNAVHGLGLKVSTSF